MVQSDISIHSKLKFLMSDATRQAGVVVGLVHRDDLTLLCIAVTTGADQGRTVYLSEDWVISSEAAT